MTEAVLIFTFSPVQSFIMEARRTSDLWAGSGILVELARAAVEAVQRGGGQLVYPAELSGDVPNKLVAVAPDDQVQALAEQAAAALRARWTAIAEQARQAFLERSPAPADQLWQEIWQRQVGSVWEVFWASAALEPGRYAEAYRLASRVLDSAKRTRAFEQVEESDDKDTLAGRRQALRTAGQDARRYWQAVSGRLGPARLRPLGRERLDALGVVKRFSPLLQSKRFPSTSTVASAPLLAAALERARPCLDEYRAVVRDLLGSYLYQVRDDRPEWPYDGDLFYQETLAPGRLADSYGLAQPDLALLQRAQRALRRLHEQAGAPPSPYYAVVVLDGDDMGKRLNDLLARGEDGRTAHSEFSQALAGFAREVDHATRDSPVSLIYNGGDDALLLAPLTLALPLARTLADRFEAITGGTASAGLAVAHHLYPLDAALAAARLAEERAKDLDGKAAVAVRVIKRSGETVELRSRWRDLGDRFDELVRLFTATSAGQPLAARFAYDVANAALSLPQADELFQAELRRLLARHRHERLLQASEVPALAERLGTWAAALPDGTEGLGRWLVFARFVAQGGGE